MPWDRAFVKAEIRKITMSESGNIVYKATITYSYYFIKHYTESDIFPRLEDAEKWIMKERTHGCMLYV